MVRLGVKDLYIFYSRPHLKIQAALQFLLGEFRGICRRLAFSCTNPSKNQEGSWTRKGYKKMKKVIWLGIVLCLLVIPTIHVLAQGIIRLPHVPVHKITPPYLSPAPSSHTIGSTDSEAIEVEFSTGGEKIGAVVIHSYKTRLDYPITLQSEGSRASGLWSLDPREWAGVEGSGFTHFHMDIAYYTGTRWESVRTRFTLQWWDGTSSPTPTPTPTPTGGGGGTYSSRLVIVIAAQSDLSSDWAFF